MTIVAFALVAAVIWAVVASLAATEQAERAQRAEDFAERCLAELKAAHRG